MSGQGDRVLVAGEPPVKGPPFPADRAGTFDASVLTARADALDRLEREPAAVDCVVTVAEDAAVLEDFLRAVEARDPTVPVVVVADGNLPPSAALEAGAAEVVAGVDPDDLPVVLGRRVETAIGAARARREPPATAVVDSIVADGELLGVFDSEGRHLAVAGDRLAEGLDPSALAGRTVGAAFLDHPSLAAHLDANYAAALDGERRERELPFDDGLYRFETIPAGDASAGLVRVRPATAAPDPPPAEEEPRSKLHRLHDIASELEAAESETEIFELAIDCAERVLEFDACTIAELEADRIVVRASTAPELDVDVELADAHEGIAGRTIETGESYLVEDVAADERANPTDDDYRSALSVPLGEDGVFQAISAEVGYYTEADLTLAELLVAHVANALDRVRFQEALTVERDHFAALFQNIPDAAVEYVLAADAEAPRIESVNSAFVRLFGYEPSAAVGESTLDLLVPADEREAAAERYEAIADGERVDGEVRRRTVEGTRPFLLRSVPVSAEGGRRGYLIYTDLRELKARERELREKNDRLERFASVVSHDLRNPLTVASAYLEQARETGDLSLLEEVERGHERTFAIIEDVLTLAREGGDVSATSAVELAGVATEAWENVDTPGATLSIEATNAVVADRGRLRRLLENCFRNAVEHGSTSPRRAGEDAVEHGADGSELTVTVSDTPHGFVVADDGVGFPEAVDDEQLFEYGFTTSDDGTGLGLAIVADIADGHGWSITATESDAGGAAVRIAGVDRPGE